MQQPQLFGEVCAPETSLSNAGSTLAPLRTTVRERRRGSAVIAIEGWEIAQAATASVAGIDTQAESEHILRCLHARTWGEFWNELESLLSAEERDLVVAARPLFYQLAYVYDRVVDRLSLRWAELNAWPPFGRIVERSRDLKPGLRACTMELLPPGSRGLLLTIEW